MKKVPSFKKKNMILDCAFLKHYIKCKRCTNNLKIIGVSKSLLTCVELCTCLCLKFFHTFLFWFSQQARLGDRCYCTVLMMRKLKLRHLSPFPWKSAGQWWRRHSNLSANDSWGLLTALSKLYWTCFLVSHSHYSIPYYFILGSISFEHFHHIMLIKWFIKKLSKFWCLLMGTLPVI